MTPLFTWQKRLNELFQPEQVVQHPQGYDPSVSADVVRLLAKGLLVTDPSGQGDILPRVAERPTGTHQEEEQYREDLQRKG